MKRWIMKFDNLTPNWQRQVVSDSNLLDYSVLIHYAYTCDEIECIINLVTSIYSLNGFSKYINTILNNYIFIKCS